ncbi:hypothetical protein [Tomitella gaofuii]|uniref:hypothetical protein n=1 Tax=Tomitella gaofuii TaxID=2760083 RepID=UPI0015FE4F65|nr:hypothetical protein [Tomitella gaofuii]
MNNETRQQVDTAIEQRSLVEWLTTEYNTALQDFTATMLDLKTKAEHNPALREYVAERMSR